MSNGLALSTLDDASKCTCNSLQGNEDVVGCAGAVAEHKGQAGLASSQASKLLRSNCCLVGQAEDVRQDLLYWW